VEGVTPSTKSISVTTVSNDSSSESWNASLASQSSSPIFVHKLFSTSLDLPRSHRFHDAAVSEA
jgi:hypothetical protein